MRRTRPQLVGKLLCWLKRNLWKTGIAITGLLLLLVLMAWLPVSAADVYEMKSVLAAPVTVTVQATPTEDATVTALNKEKLAQEVQQLKNQNEPTFFDWLRTNASILLSTLVVVIGGLIGLFRWFGDRRSQREKRDEDRFQAVVTGLGSDNILARIGEVITLHTFLQPGYERFYRQTFDLTVAHLQLRKPDLETKDDLEASNLASLNQALIGVLEEAFPRAREWVKQGSPSSRLQWITARLKRLLPIDKSFDSQSLDATSIQLDNAYLKGADLKQAWMPLASLRKANLIHADLSNARLVDADLSEALLGGTILSQVDLSRADLSKARLNGANLSNARLVDADLSEATLHQTNLSGDNLSRADLSGADLSGADLSGANLSNAKLHEAKYNTKKIEKKDAQGKSYTLKPTIWPQGFDLLSAELNCVDC